MGGNESDFYVGCRALAGELKASFHQSGQWHVAYTRGFYDRSFSPESPKPPTRFIERWTRPKEIAPGVTLPIRIVVPWSSATVRASEEPEDCVWVPPATEGFAVEFAVVVTSPDCVVADWPARRSMNSQLVGSFPLASGEHVWVIWTEQVFVLPKQQPGRLAFFKGQNRASLLGGNLRALALAVNDDGSRVLYDAPVSLGAA